ncbi:hypothetical protein Hypma_007287 [Hypsizygus marmoreus]|uniref:Uncharacterized protein n=1 Tax=Hypsizygus marmoreus TaxID=39966 RepID=A0A369KFA3_HYPMA|nr:hypothetical protein Hypma_007287 [Hypsizygus marmoreus]
MNAVISVNPEPVESPVMDGSLPILCPSLKQPPSETDLQFRRRVSESHVPSPAETSIIHRAVAHAHRALARLQEERRALQCYIDEQTYITAPIRRLPPEILGKIMIEVHPVRDVCKSGGYDAVWLASVCRLWRDVSLSIPPLWSSFNLVWDTAAKVSGPAAHKTMANSLALHLSRSGIYSLSIDITFNRFPDGPPMIVPGAFFAQFASHSDRWHSLRIDGPPGMVNSVLQLANPPVQNLPALQYLNICSDSTILDGKIPTPNLHTLKVFSTYCLPRIHHHCGRHVTTLKLHCSDASCVLGVLRSCAQVRDLSVLLSGSSSLSSATDCRPITLLHCLSFTLTWMSWEHWHQATFQQLFLSLSLPVAQKIVMNNGTGHALWSRSPFELLKRTPSLEDLTLNAVGFLGEMGIFKCAPHLHTLKIYPPNFPTSTEKSYIEAQHHELMCRLIRCLPIPPHTELSDVLLPKLESLEVMNVNDSVWCRRWGPMRSALETRWKGSPLIMGGTQISGLRRLLITIADTPKARRFQSRIQKYVTTSGMYIRVQLDDQAKRQSA